MITGDQIKITGHQIKLARKLLGWSATRLAMRAHRRPNTIQKAENGGKGVTAKSLEAIKYTLEAAGLEFTDSGEPGVRLKKTVSAIEAVSEQIEALDEQGGQYRESGRAEPEAAMNVMRKAVAENDLKTIGK